MSNLILHIRKFSNKVISNIFITDTKNNFFVGRWSIPNTGNNNHHNHNINLIIDRNNEDHCGVCETNNINNLQTIDINLNKRKEQEENYYIAFFM